MPDFNRCLRLTTDTSVNKPWLSSLLFSCYGRWKFDINYGTPCTASVILQFEFLDILFFHFLVTWEATSIVIDLCSSLTSHISGRKHGILCWQEIKRVWDGTRGPRNLQSVLRTTDVTFFGCTWKKPSIANQSVSLQTSDTYITKKCGEEGRKCVFSGQDCDHC